MKVLEVQEYKVKEIDWENKHHPGLRLWGIFKQNRRGYWRWYCLITDDKQHAEEYLKDFLKEIKRR